MLYSVGDVIHYTSINRPYSTAIVIRRVIHSADSYNTSELSSDGTLEAGGNYDEWYLRDKCTVHRVYPTIEAFKDINPEFFI